MDPNATLAVMLDRAEALIASADAGGEVDDEAHELAEATISLHEWLSKGGFLPRQWTGAKR